MINKIIDSLNEADLLVFSDFNYGSLPQIVVDTLVEEAGKRNIMMVADSQASSQVSDISRYKNMCLLTPTEHEARLALRDNTSGLVVLADDLRKKSSAQMIVLTMGKEGLLIHAPNDSNSEILTDKLPAFNTSPKDVSGAGDSLLISTALAIASGCNIWQSIYLGSISAAC